MPSRHVRSAALRTKSIFRCFLGCFTLLVMVAHSTVALAQQAGNGEQMLRDHLAAGEFGPARELAHREADPAVRNGWLRDIAAAQAKAGALHAAVGTASSISDDQFRGSLLNQIGSQPIAAARGGGPQADFDSLIELITSTIAPDSWEENGGAGAIDGFEGGVYVDSLGMLRKLTIRSDHGSIAGVRKKAAREGLNLDVRKTSSLRKVSLVRLEKQVQMLRALGRDPNEAMQALAGMHKIKYVFVYPETGDIVLAGPAGDWRVDAEGRRVNADTGRPTLNLDDLVVVLRNAFTEDGRFGCSINPRKENLANTKKFLEASTLKGAAWRHKLRETLGTQDIEVYGIDPRSRAGRVMVEADYRMKLVGMGLEKGTLGVSSYLDSVKVGDDGVMPTSVIRWWFTLNYKALQTTKTRDAFEIHGQGVKVLSENELLTERGERVHTGKSDIPTQEFAHSFTKQFKLLATKYPIYTELQNLFDLALVAAVIRTEDMPGQVGWHMTHFGPSVKGENLGRYRVELGAAPKEVETVMNHRIITHRKPGGVLRKFTIAGVSGGVAVHTTPLVRRQAIQVDDYGAMRAERVGSVPKNLSHNAWWWD